MDSEAAANVISNAVKSLVDHSRSSSRTSSSCISSNGTSGNDAPKDSSSRRGYSVPAFDPLLGKPISLDPMTRDCVDRLTSGTNSRNVPQVCLEWMKSYGSTIRQECFQSPTREKTLHVKSHAVSVLIPFEQMLDEYTAYIHRERLILGHSEEGIACHDDSCYSVAATAVERLVLDIFSLTAVRDFGMDVERSSTSLESHNDNINMEREEQQQKDSKNVSFEIIQNVILPVLLRILQHMIDIQRFLVLLDAKDSQNISVSEIAKTRIRYSIAVASLAALAFGKDEIFPQEGGESVICLSSDLHVLEVIPESMLREIALQHIFIDRSTYSPTCVKSSNGEAYLEKLYDFANLRQGSLSFLDRSILDMEHATSSSIPSTWLDHTKGIGTRAAFSLLQRIARLSILVGVGAGANKGQQSSPSSEKVAKCFRDIILPTVGPEYMCKMARGLFFGRITSSCSTSPDPSRRDNTSTILKSLASHDVSFNGILGGTKKSDDDVADLDSQIMHSNRTQRSITRHILQYTDSEPFKEVPAVSIAAIRVMAGLKFPVFQTDVLLECLPVAFTLIDSITDCHQTFGASILGNILTETTSTCFTSLRYGEKGDGSYFEHAQKVLSIACRTCKNALSFFLLTRARSKLFEMAPVKQGNKLRREAVSETLDWIQKNSYAGPGAERKSLELLCVCLVACLQPMLHDLAQLPDAGAMELGRSGLTVLLPLVRWDSNTHWGRRIQVAAMECLLSLMMGAYPIMEGHGGKIMSELIACVGRLQRDLVIQDKTQTTGNHEETYEQLATKITMVIAMHVASAALVLCGKRAEEVLIKIESGSYLTTLVNACSIIRSGAAIMTAQQ